MSNDAPDRVSADLREHERQNDIAEKVGARADEIARELAYDLIGNHVGLFELVSDCDLDIWGHLARAMNNIDAACTGDGIARSACLEALSRIEGIVLDKAREAVAEKAICDAWVEHNES